MGILNSITGWTYRRIEYIPKLLYYLLLIVLIFMVWKFLKWIFRSFSYVIKDWRYGRSMRKIQEKALVYGTA